MIDDLLNQMNPERLTVALRILKMLDANTSYSLMELEAQIEWGLPGLAPGTLCVILAHPNVPVSLLIKCALSPFSFIRAEAACHDRLPIEHLCRLTQDPEKYVRDFASNNPNCPIWAKVAGKIGGL